MGCGAGAAASYAPSESFSPSSAGNPSTRRRRPGADSPAPSASSRSLTTAAVTAAAASSALPPRGRTREECLELAGRLRSCGLNACRRLAAEIESPLKKKTPEAIPLAAPRFEAGRRGADVATMLEWDAWLDGPQDTPYAGGVFRLLVKFPKEYPMAPPAVRFVTPCYHPNVSARSGEICLNILKEEWNPLLTLTTTLLCISALLSQPTPDDPLNVEAAEVLMSSPTDFDRTVVEWTRRYAGSGWANGASGHHVAVGSSRAAASSSSERWHPSGAFADSTARRSAW